MREGIGGIWLTQLVILFILIFVAFLALSLNYTKAFKVKNELLTIIEKREGMTSGDNGSIGIINNYLKSNAYFVTHGCPENSYGVRDLNSQALTLVTKNDKSEYYYCVTKVHSPISNNKNNYYYKVNIFFYFNLPVLGDIFKFDVNGSTKNITNPADKLQSY